MKYKERTCAIEGETLQKRIHERSTIEIEKTHNRWNSGKIDNGNVRLVQHWPYEDKQTILIW